MSLPCLVLTWTSHTLTPDLWSLSRVSTLALPPDGLIDSKLCSVFPGCWGGGPAHDWGGPVHLHPANQSAQRWHTGNEHTITEHTYVSEYKTTEQTYVLKIWLLNTHRYWMHNNWTHTETVDTATKHTQVLETQLLNTRILKTWLVDTLILKILLLNTPLLLWRHNCLPDTGSEFNPELTHVWKTQLPNPHARKRQLLNTRRYWRHSYLTDILKTQLLNTRRYWRLSTHG